MFIVYNYNYFFISIDLDLFVMNKEFMFFFLCANWKKFIFVFDYISRTKLAEIKRPEAKLPDISRFLVVSGKSHGKKAAACNTMPRWLMNTFDPRGCFAKMNPRFSVTRDTRRTSNLIGDGVSRHWPAASCFKIERSRRALICFSNGSSYHLYLWYFRRDAAKM